MPITDAHREQLVGALSVPKPYFGEGIHEFEQDALTLWFGSADNLSRVSLARNGMGTAELSTLFSACQPATFGRNAEDVLDESYRKAGKLDKSNFAINLDLVGSGLLDKVHDALFGWEATRRDIRAELYKLNVYGPGSFFKAHKDTPRGEEMFGSLVLNFPITHEGGALMLRHDGREAAHDPSVASYTADNQVSWVTFFSDVEHEVLPVTTGHRVTITYNLYHVQRPPAGIFAPLDAEPILKLLQSLLADPTFLPDGGRLGFGLSHQYPVPSTEERKDQIDSVHHSDDDQNATKDLGPHDKPQRGLLRRLQALLKGQDAALFTSANQLDLDPRLAVTYETEYSGMFLLYSLWDGGYQVESFKESLEEYADGEMFEKPEDEYQEDDDDVRPHSWGEIKLTRREKIARNGGPIVWVVERSGNARFGTNYVAYGNDASLSTIYADIVLVARVQPAAARISAPAA